MGSALRNRFDDYRVERDVTSVVTALTSRGLVFFDGNPSRKDLILIAESLGKIHLHRDSDDQGLTILEPKDAPSPLQAGFTAQGLFPHTDASGESCPPDIMIFYCEQMAHLGGESLLVDGRELFLELRQERSELLSILTRPDEAMFWSDAGHVPMPIIDQDRSGRLAIRFRYDHLSLFSDRLAYKLQELVDLVHRHTFSIQLKNGEGFILNNGWWLHGRNAYHGYRRAVRILVDVGGSTGQDIPAPLRGFVV